MKTFTVVSEHLTSRAFWAGFFSAFSLDITGRTQARMIGDAFGYERSRIRTTREILERTDEEALEADREALARDWEAIAKDFPVAQENPFSSR